MNNDEIVPGFDKDKDEAIKIRLQRIDDRCIVLCLNGRIDFYSTNYTEKQLDKVLEKGFVKLIFDCRQLNYVSSTGVGVFVRLLKTVKLRNGDLVMMHIQPRVWEVFKLLGFSMFFTIIDDLDEAIHSFNGIIKDWPIIFKCPICEKRLKAIKAGRYRCRECRTILVLNSEMQIALG